ncbi:MAG TPA: IPT/TIG domain-containing protein [Solirubrobacterales bacterium]
MAIVIALASAAQASAADFLLEVEVTGEGNVGCMVNGGGLEGCEAEFEEGTQVTVIAEPEEGSEFVEWGGECDVETGNECEVEMDEAKFIEAVFGLEEFELTVETEGTGEGIVECEAEVGPAEPCLESETYLYGTEVSLYAEPEEGSEFVEWGGACSGEEEQCSLVIEEPLSVTATFEPGPFFGLKVETEGTGEGIVECEVDGLTEECEAEGEYPEGTVVTLYAEPSGGSEFVAWGGECDVVAGNECEVEMNEERTVEAVFNSTGPVEEFELEVSVTGEGKVDADSGAIVNCRESSSPCSDEYAKGTVVTLTATADSGNKFEGWTGCPAVEGNKCKVTMSADKSVTAEFVPVGEFELDVTVTGDGKVDANSGAIVGCRESSGVCFDDYVEGTVVTLTATADAGNEFDGWTGCDSEPSGKCQVTMDEAKSVTAEFVEIPVEEFELEVSVTGEGKVDANSGAIVGCREVGGVCFDDYVEGTVVTLTATADAGNEFDGWTDCDTVEGNKCKMTMSADKSVEAEFVTTPAPTVTALSPTSGSTAGGNVVEITGTNLTGATKVKFGTTEVSSPFGENTATKIKVTAPAHAAETVDVRVVTAGGESANTAADNYTYVSPPILTITKAGTGSGTVTCDGGACAASYPTGTEVTLAASPASGSTFAGWSGGCSGTGGCVVTLIADTTVTAAFTANPPPPTCATDPSLCPPPPNGIATAAGSAKVSGGKAALKITCSGGPCSGSFKLKAKVKQGTKTKNLVIGKASFSLAAGTTKTLKVKLSGPAKQELTRVKTLKAKLSGSGITARTVKLKLAK